MGDALLLFNISRPQRLTELSNVTQMASRTLAGNSRYYGVVRLLYHPSVLPSVDPWLHVSPDPNPEAFLLVWERMGSSLGFPANLFGNMPRAKDTADPSTTSQ